MLSSPIIPFTNKQLPSPKFNIDPENDSSKTTVLLLFAYFRGYVKFQGRSTKTKQINNYHPLYSTNINNYVKTENKITEPHQKPFPFYIPETPDRKSVV